MNFVRCLIKRLYLRYVWPKDAPWSADIQWESMLVELRETHFNANAYGKLDTHAMDLLSVWLDGVLCNAPNYVSINVAHKDGGAYTLTIQRPFGISPADKVAKLEARIRQLEDA